MGRPRIIQAECSYGALTKKMNKKKNFGYFCKNYNCNFLQGGTCPDSVTKLNTAFTYSSKVFFKFYFNPFASNSNLDFCVKYVHPSKLLEITPITNNKPI